MLTGVGTFAKGRPLTAVFLHGWGSDERDLAGLSPYLPVELPWASVRAPLRHPAFGYAWYVLDSERSWDDAHAIGATTDALWEWVDEALGQDAKVLPIGFSQGGVMASQLLRTRPDRVPGAAILSGYVLPSALPADAVLAAAPPPVFWGRGALDTVIPPHALAATEEFLPGHSTLERRVYEGLSHSVSERELADLAQFVRGVVG